MKCCLQTLVITLLLISMCLSLFTGCGAKEPALEESGSTGTGVKTDATSEERITVKVFRLKMPFEASMDDMEVFDVMSEKFNIDFVFENPSYENYMERLNLVMMDDDIPDVLMGIPTSELTKYADTGIIIPLEDYIETKMPSYKAILDSHRGMAETLISNDGHTYQLTEFKETYSGNTPYIVRTDWLKQLGIEAPVTIEEWENYWELVKTTDLNGNSKNDEIPFSGYGLEKLRNFCTAWGVVDGFYTDPEDNGKVHYGPIEDEFKEAVIWMNEMWEKGYIDPECLTLTESTFTGRIAQNIVGSFSGTLGGMMATPNASMQESVPGFRLDATQPPIGPAGVQIHTNIDSKGGTGMAVACITSACENVDRVVEWLEYMYSDEGALLMNMGVEGKHYTMENGEAVYTDFVSNNPDGLTPKYAVGSFSIMQGFGPSIMLDSCINGVDDASVVQAKATCIDPFIEESSKYILPSTLTFSPEQNEIITGTMTDVEIYVDEMIMKFISGREPIENWDVYVAKVKDMGIEKVISTYQSVMTSYSS